MEKVIRVFHSHEEADAADREYYRSLTPEQRLRILLQIIADHDGSEYAARVERVCRVSRRLKC